MKMKTSRRPTSRTRAALLGAILVTLAAPAAGSAQTILGRVLDQRRETPVDGVLVTLIDRSGTERLHAITDVTGRFRLTPPEAGEYLLATQRLGYLETRSPLIALGVDGEAPLELMIVPAPLGLDGIEVSV